MKCELKEENVFEIKLENGVVKNVTKDYEKLDNQPQINDIVLLGNKTSKDLKLQDEMDSISNLDIDKIFNL